MCCSDCKKWDTCNKVDYPSNRLIRPCFAGYAVRLPVEDIDNYRKDHARMYIPCVDGFWVGAVHKSAWLFDIYFLKLDRQDGAMYACSMHKVQGYYVNKLQKINIFINGMDLSMQKSTFYFRFGIKIDSAYINSIKAQMDRQRDERIALMQKVVNDEGGVNNGECNQNN